nr:semaphorin-6C-like [Aegilops tauschii subsp. strangulata]
MAMPPGSGHPRASPRAAAVVIFKLVAPSPPRHSPEPPQAVPVAESPAGRLCLDPASSPPAAVTAPCTPLPRAASPPSSDKRRASCLSATPLQLPLQTVAFAPSCLLRAHLLSFPTNGSPMVTSTPSTTTRKTEDDKHPLRAVKTASAKYHDGPRRVRIRQVR